MLKMIYARIREGHRTIRYPEGPAPAMPERFRGLPSVRNELCRAKCALCAGICPTGAISLRGGVSIDLGRCIFCGECAAACPEKAVTFSGDYRMAAGERSGLIISGEHPEAALARELDARMKSLFGRSLKLRQVSAGGCNACEADSNVLTTIGWDMGRFGIQFVASPRHADGLLITGPVTRNMELALKKTWEALPDPRIVIAVGACAISGGLYDECPEAGTGAGDHVPVDLYIPGCPPHPMTILDGLLRLLGRLKETGKK
jgi:Ni,Fe-hydrogenase III small subunit/formate hydrogenlyase subunit 6/NADH:ubiquinone oxidoreductase subunit I